MALRWFIYDPGKNATFLINRLFWYRACFFIVLAVATLPLNSIINCNLLLVLTLSNDQWKTVALFSANQMFSFKYFQNYSFKFNMSKCQSLSMDFLHSCYTQTLVIAICYFQIKIIKLKTISLCDCKNWGKKRATKIKRK